MKKEPLFIAFSTQKGGAGKTTLTVLMASHGEQPRTNQDSSDNGLHLLPDSRRPFHHGKLAEVCKHHQRHADHHRQVEHQGYPIAVEHGGQAREDRPVRHLRQGDSRDGTPACPTASVSARKARRKATARFSAPHCCRRTRRWRKEAASTPLRKKYSAS